MIQWKLVPDFLFDDAKQIFCSDVEPNTNGDCADVIEWFKASLAAAPQPDGEPFGIWHQGETEEESDFFLFKDAGNVSCDKCIKLYTYPPDAQARIKELEAQRDELVEALKLAKAGFSQAASGRISQKYLEEHYEAVEESLAKVNGGK